ncbi:MAG: 6-phosphofructokinase [Planctomycetes bacterium]|nr:6-phosphofructokinase [Planctomycetota bacterium]
MKAPVGNALIGQSGGPTHVINQSLVGVVEAARSSGVIRNVYGALHGIKGVLEEQLIDLGAESEATLEAVAMTPGAALRSVRKKPTREECEKALAVFKRYDVRYVFYIGGNDSAETAHILSEIAGQSSYDLRLFHVPKTIDNDLRVTDHCPGYGSAARYVACSFLGDNVDVRSLPGVKLNVVMGRNAGWLTAASALARQFTDDGPHLIYVPETNFSVDGFVADVERVQRELGRCIVAISEGVHDAAGKLIAESKEVDSHGNLQLSGSGALGDQLSQVLKARLGAKLRVRADTFGYAQRSYFGAASAVDAMEAREIGRVAVRLATQSDAPTGSISILRESNAPYRVRYERTELKLVAHDTRPMESTLLRGTNDVSAAFLEYARPLVGELPRAARLSDVPVKKS